MQLTDSPVANPVAVLREEFDDWAVLYNPDSGAAVGINPIGVAIWKLADGRRTVQGITQAIIDAFTDAPGSAPEEIKAFVDSLARHGFLGLPVTGDGR